MPDPRQTSVDDLVNRILSAFPQTRYQWRTVRGLARELGIREDAVAAVIGGRPDLFRKSALSPAGIALYRPRESQVSPVSD